MKNILLIGITAFAASVFTACSSDDADRGVTPTPDASFVEAPKCDATVAVRVNNPLSRAANVDGSIDRYTATRVDGAGSNYTLVSYHGRNQEQIGMVQIVRNTTGEVISELNTLDARVNFAQYRRTRDGQETAYIGVDRQGSDGIMCGIIAVPMSGGRFVGSADVTTYTPYKVEGQSLNCLKYTGNFTATETGENVLFAASGGNEALGVDGKAGFTKFAISPDDPTKLSVLAEKTSANYRGYWFSYDFLASSPMAYTYRTVEDGKLVYKVGLIRNEDARTLIDTNDAFIDTYDHPEAVVLTRDDTTEDRCRFGVSTIALGGSTYAVASTGNKEGGVQVYRHVGADNSLLLVDKWDKICMNTSSLLHAPDGKYYIFASCAGGVFKLEVQQDPETKALRLEPVAKRPVTVTTESETLSSTNYVQLRGQNVHVAGGYEGYYVLAWDDPQFIPADPRD